MNKKGEKQKETRMTSNTTKCSSFTPTTTLTGSHKTFKLAVG